MDTFPNLCLGTAQFGLDYGLTNRNGKVESTNVEEILNFAFYNEIKLLDTAQAYGEAEKIIGKNLIKNNHFKVISKINTEMNYENNTEFLEILENNLKSSLKKLSSTKLYGLLIHNVGSLKNSKYRLIKEWLISLKDRKIVKNIGISIYEKNDLDKVDLDKLDIVQLPLSIYDQRLLNDGTIKSLKKSGFKIHARSIFLQGLVLQSYITWPDFLSTNFKSHHKSFEQDINNNNLTKLKASLSFFKTCKDIDVILVGITSKKELEEIQNALEEIKNESIECPIAYKKYSWDKIYDIDPRKWIKRGS